ncbi:c-type cytochrome [Paracoccus ravus]|uniref:c-type cytochrome n=1 Tax=Paracoccus ravus TaxID=2447760 RepID=UPI00106F08E7|nr:cytochrome c [Paracoccus ravus]
MRLILTAASFALLPLFPLTAIADDELVENAIEARHGYYKMLALNMATLAGMAKGDVAYDEAAASQAAANIAALTHYDLPSLFVEGSASGQAEDSAAKPEIWTDMDDFKAKFQGLVEAAAGAPEAVKGGQDQLGPVVGKLGGACKACHDSYRVKG